jgi:Flp pilus assembly protein TadD
MIRWRFGLLLVLVLSAVYLYAFPRATMIYGGGVLFHVGAGILLAMLLIPTLRQVFRDCPLEIRFGWLLIAAGTVLGLILIKIGTPNRFRIWLYAHIALCAVGVLFVGASWLTRRGWLGKGFAGATASLATLALLMTGVAVGSWYTRTVAWRNSARVANPRMPAETMDGEGDGPNGKFFPSSVQTRDGKNIPAKYFMQSQACQRCHKDIYNQWNSSAHHFSSFNNQWYRKSIEYMQDVAGVKSSKWCAGCHDPALLFSGMFDTPVRQIENTPAGQAGLACMMCHSIVEVKSTMGQGDFVLEYPKLHELAASENPVMRALHDFMVKINPEPHRRTFLKPFMREQTAEFCSGCHKVHLDVPVNRYRWVRGFNEYDNWQASGVSGQGARSFYYPANSMMCADCHMPLQPSKDEGNINGFVHSHRFPGANTAVPTANEDPAQLAQSVKFLQDKQVTVDVFGISPAGKETPTALPSATGAPELSTTFAVGEEADISSPKGVKGEARPISAPLGRVQANVRRGDDYLVDVVVRTRKVGHFFPGGTVDAFDVWLELQATDEKGNILFWSGKVQDDGKGPVEPGAHFYRSQQIDAHGNVINKRNAWSGRAVVYVHLIPPGAADTVHYRIHIPENAGEKINLHAKLNYRKFMWWNTQFAYAGEEDSQQPKGATTPDYDDRKFNFHADTSGVAGKLKKIPDLPIITVAEDTKSVFVLPNKSLAPAPNAVAKKEDWMRWNDYGIGLFLQGDLQGAEAAFTKDTEADPNNFDGWVNIGRVRTQEGDTAGAITVLDKALSLKPDLARANYFYARDLKEEGKYDEAVAKLQSVLKQYPRDRVVRNELGRIYFLQKKYQEAVTQFEYTLSIDPEDLQAHYNLMLCYNGLGDEAKAEAYKVRYLRFKADESSQAVTGPYRQTHPDENNERQAVHEHMSVALNAPTTVSPNAQKSASTTKKSAAARTDKFARKSPSGKD